ncbi:glycogen synthase GlgA [Collinsella provencensis]|uniref:glycogen synthase GlgA n=1 Tax=Collinsella provencensis TaxID=1937461 RepID=UPI000C86835E|nr:glycogen synthase GlgA [Collinsella provencensis]
MTEEVTPKLHVAFASAEAAPFVKTGGLGDVAGSLPHALKAAGAEVVVLTPKYDTIAQEYKDRMEHLCDFYVPLGWRNEYCGIERLNHKGVDYLFLDNEHYFSRGYPYGFFDDGERFAFFSKAIVESLQYLPNVIEGFTCDVLHCNDWHTAMAPVFLREFYQASPLYRNVKTVFSIHNIAFQGQFSAKVLNDILGLAHVPAAAFQLTCGPDAINYMQGALNYTDSITTVSPTYAEEIKTPEFGEGLDGLLRRRAPILQGILNGIDVEGFNPATDSRIAANFTVNDRSGKAICKAKLQEELGLEVRDDRPLMVMVTRLTRQKGMDLVTYALDRILSGGVQVAVLGTGDAEYENALRYFEHKYPGTMAARIQFDPALSQRMYAAADLFLMPSLFEPCGLSQIIAMRYGTLPVVRETGGLKDTVIPYNQYTGEGTGFSFANFNGDELGDTVFRAARLFWDDRKAFDQLVTNAMKQDFSWTRSAGEYLAVYHNLHPEIPMPGAATVDAPAKDEAEAPAPEKDEEKTPTKKTPAKTAAAKKPAAKTTTKKTATKTTTKKASADIEAKPAAKKPATKKKTVAAKTTNAPEGTTGPIAEKPAAKAPARTAKTATTKATASKTTTAKKATTKAATSKKAVKEPEVVAKPADEKPAATKSTAKKAAVEAKPATEAKPAPAKTAAAKTATQKKQPAKSVSEAKGTRKGARK